MRNGTNLKIFSGNSNLPLAKEICAYLNLEIGDALVTSFPDSESFVRYNENIRGMDVFLLQSSNSPANHNIMELLIMVDAARRASAARISVVIPFFGYARQDRRVRSARVPITSSASYPGSSKTLRPSALEKSRKKGICFFKSSGHSSRFALYSE